MGGAEKKLRKYFGRGQEAEIEARAFDHKRKVDKAQALATGGVTFNDPAKIYTEQKFVHGEMSETDQTATYYRLEASILPFLGKASGALHR
jgi:hypothetical protein